MKETTMSVCKYCGKSLNGEVRFNRGGNTFCDETHATLHDYSDTYVLPPREPDQPFEKEIV
jgi:hypothetical protein